MNTRKIGLFDAILLVSGSMIGSGVFIVISEMSRNLGNAYWVLFAWILTGLITLMAALSFGELASMMPNAGGQYTFISRIYGRTFGFIYGWSVFSVIQTGVIAAVAMAFAKYLGVIFPQWGPTAYIVDLNIFEGFHLTLSKAQLVAVSMIAFLTCVNTFGIQEGKWIQRIFTLAKLMALFAIILVGMYFLFGGSIDGVPKYSNINFNGDLRIYSFTNNTWTTLAGFGLFLGFSSAMVGSLFSADAWQGITFMSNEVEHPSKNIPKALVYGTTLVTVIYVLANLSYMMILPLKGDASVVAMPSGSAEVYNLGIAHADQNRVGAAAASAFLGVLSNASAGKLGMSIMACLILISTFGCNNGLILSGSRLYKAMSDEGLFFKSASKLNNRNIPSNALWMQFVWSSVLCLSGSYETLLQYCTLASLLFYVVTVVGLLILRKREPNANRPYKVWGYPYLPVTYIVLAGLVAIGILISNFQVAIMGLGIVALGWPVYILFDRKTS